MARLKAGAKPRVYKKVNRKEGRLDDTLHVAIPVGSRYYSWMFGGTILASMNHPYDRTLDLPYQRALVGIPEFDKFFPGTTPADFGVL